MNTTCEHCIFAVREGQTQVGCVFKRLSKFIELGQAKLEGQNYSIENYCNLCRNVYWDEYVSRENDADINKLADIAEKEIRLQYDALIDIEKAKQKDIKKTLAYLDTLDYKPRKILLFGQLNEDNLKLTKKFKDAPKVVVTLHISDDKFTQSAAYVHKSVANYLLFLMPGMEFKLDIDSFDKAMNIDLIPKIYHNDSKCFFVSTFFYKNHIQYNNPFQVIVNGYDEYGKPKN